MRPRNVISAILMAACCVVAAPAARANLIVNGGFEMPGVPASSLTCGASFNTDCQGYFSPDQPGFDASWPHDIAGWSVIGKGGAPGSAVIMQLGKGYTETDFANSTTLFFHAQSGKQSLDLTGEGNEGPNGIKQSISSVSGAHYKISFYVGNQFDLADGYHNPSSIDFYLDGVYVDTFTNSDTTSEDVDWKRFAYGFDAATNFTTFAFISATPVGDNYAGLDHVFLAVPEPGSLALLGFGMTAFITLRRRKSSRA